MFEELKNGIAYKVYEIGDINRPSRVIPHPGIKPGDWIEDINGLLTQVVNVKWFRGDIISVYVDTVFGLDPILRWAKKGYWGIYPVDFKRERLNKNSFSAGKKVKLTQKDKWLLKALFYSGDMFEAYRVVYGQAIKNETQKHNLKFKFKRLLSMPESEEYYRDRVMEILVEKGVAKPEFFVNKLVESVDGKIDSVVKLNIVKMLAKAVGDKDINRLMDNEEGEQRTLIPLKPQSVLMENNGSDDGSKSSEGQDR